MTEHSSANLTASLLKLEFDKIISRISQCAVSDVGRALAQHILPLPSKELITLELQRVSEAKELLIAEGTVPMDRVQNIVPALKKTTVENQSLTIGELLDVASVIGTSRSMHAFLLKRKQQYRNLATYTAGLLSDKIVEYNIERAIDVQGFVKDTASKELKAVRQDIVDVSEQLRKSLEKILRRVSEKDFLQEEIITTRDGRLVIPVKVEHKNHVPGFIHSASGSGATVYIEPAETLELNNGLRELHLREEREIQRILRELTDQVREIREPLGQSLETLAVLDLLFAKGRYSIEVIGNPPRISDTPMVRLVQARHPVLLQRHPREDVVPLDLQLGGDVTTLVITGPNAGGKTVALKTVGLLSLCAQSGIHIPAASETELFPFDQVFVDIGDDQSIENDLSSFSSHLMHLKEILAGADNRSLVLVDEIGSGTDPAEGGALAATVLKELTDRKTLTIATTHHGVLKVFAHETPGMTNGSMEFDQATLTPVYRFRSGVPGSSFALELAERMGIPRAILEGARNQLGDEKAKLERLIAELEKQSQLLAAQLKEVSRERDRLQSTVTQYEQKMSELRKEISGIRRKAVEEAKDLVKNAQAVIEQSIREIRESGASKEVVQASRQRVNEFRDQLPAEHRESTEEEKEALAIGDTVKLRTGTEAGTILEIQGKSAVVLWGSAKLRVKVGELVKEKVRKEHAAPPSVDAFTVDAGSEIDLRGMTGDEAVAQIETFLSNAYSSGLHRVDLIHGKGTGALRKRITEFLKHYPYVRSFRLGEWNEGGMGVTVVELRED